MARRKTKKTEEVDTTEEIKIIETEEVAKDAYADILEVTDEFNLQDVSDVDETIKGEDLDTTEVEAVIEDGAEIELIEDSVSAKKPEAKRNRTTVDKRTDASAILKAQKEKENSEEARKHKERQQMSRVKPVIAQTKKNNGIRTSSGLFSR